MLHEGYTVRRLALDDAAAVAASYARNQEHLRPWEPTRADNPTSQTVLMRCGFEQYGLIPDFLYLDGDWRDSVLFNLMLHDGPLRG